VFDVLAAAGIDLRSQPYRVRRERLVDLLADVRPPLAVIPVTEAPRPRRGCTSISTPMSRVVPARRTAEAIVGGVLGRPGGPTSLVLGHPGARGRLRVVGRTAPLPAVVAHRDLAALLVIAGDEHPWPALLPSTRFGQTPGELIRYLRVDPNIVVEIDVDSAVEWGRYRHPTRYWRMGRPATGGPRADSWSAVRELG
jgi:hypothetical protein